MGYLSPLNATDNPPNMNDPATQNDYNKFALPPN